MRSPVDVPAARAARRGIEWALRIALLLSLVLAIEEAVTLIKQRPSLRVAGSDSAIRKTLREWSTRSWPADVHAMFDTTPAPATLDWIAALPGAGTRISWESSLAPVGIGVEPIVDPKRAARILVAAPSGSRVELKDSLGAMDSVSVKKAGASVGPVIVHGAAIATVRGSVARGGQPDSLLIRPVLVVGRAGWDAKFLVASLEEYGWKVDARLAVAPANDAVLGSPAMQLDTSRFSAVVVIDSSAGRYASAIDRYVRRGGGLIAIGEAATLPAFSSLLPAVAGDVIPPGDVSVGDPKTGLALAALTLKAGSIPLEKRGNRVAIAARRVGAGRVVQVGYVDSWRWRMGGSGDALEDYRSWLTSVVGSAAYAPRIEKPELISPDAAPVATLYASLGNPSARARGLPTGDGSRWMLALFIVAISALILETASRRIDGKP